MAVLLSLDTLTVASVPEVTVTVGTSCWRRMKDGPAEIVTSTLSLTGMNQDAMMCVPISVCFTPDADKLRVTG